MSLKADQATATHVHPLAPLSGEELERAASIVRAADRFESSCRFATIALHEPERAAVAAWAAGEVVATRDADVVLYERASGNVHEVVVSITAGEIISWETLNGVQPGIMIEEATAVEEVVRADPRWQEAMRKRGVTDFDLAQLDPWPLGYNGEQDSARRRLCRALTWMRAAPGDHQSPRPVEGLVVTYDMDRQQVIEVEDHGVVPIPQHAGNYTAPHVFADNNLPRFDSYRDDLKTFEITQPDGPSFHVDAHSVTWQKWSFQVGWNPREGLVLHDVRYDDRGTDRPVFYRLAVAEMVVPYGDPAPTHARKLAFDEGEVGLGLLVSPLMLGCDCLGEIHYFNAIMTDQDGMAIEIPNAICMHEEDVGTGWKHFDFRSGEGEVQRTRRLVVSTFVNLGNYDYGFFWYFHQDGSIEFEAKLTGVISTGAYALDGPQPEYGEPVAPGLYGPNHQHFFCVRMEPTIDGDENTVVEVNTVAMPNGPRNPYGTAWKAVETPLRTEHEAQRLVNAASARYWKIVNRSTTNALGRPVAYRLEPGGNVGLFMDEGSNHWRRAEFASKHLWVTPNQPDERYAAGQYPAQSPGHEGLPRWTEANRSVEDTNIAVWYVFGTHHVVRVEDWPITPVKRIGFHLTPDGFFDGNPALDVAPSHGHSDHAAENPASGNGDPRGGCGVHGHEGTVTG